MNLHKQLALMLANLRKKRPYYCEVEYLESTGTQWFDIGTTVNTETDEIELYFQLTETNNYKWFFGEYDTNNRLGLGSGDGENKRNFLYLSSAVKVNDSDTYNSMHKFEINSSGAFLDGVKKANYSAFASTSTMYLFNLNIDSSSDYKCKGKSFAFRQKRSGALIRDLIPVLDWDFVPCMYDRITGQFFYNAGTGTFSYGREIHYVDYLESTGTQYIDTGVVLTNNHSVEIDYQLTATGQSRTGLFGNLNTARYGSLFSPSNKQLEHGYGAGNDYWQQGAQDTNRHVFKQEKNKIYVDGVLAHTFSQATFNVGVSAPLGNFGYTNYTPAKAIYRYSKWWDGDTLVRDFCPAIDENGVGFWFDRVERKIYDNAGTDKFKYPAVETEYLEVTDLGSTANKRPCIDLGLKYKSSMSVEGKYTRTAQGDSGSVLLLSTNTTPPLIYLPALEAGSMKDRFVWRRNGYTEQRQDFTFNSYPVSVEVKLDAVNDTLELNGQVVKTGMIAAMGGSTPYESSSNLYMLSIDGAYGGLGKVYPMKIYDTEQVYRDLIPAWKDGEFGIYDKEHDVLYQNTKEGTIASGKIVEPEYEQ